MSSQLLGYLRRLGPTAKPWSGLVRLVQQEPVARHVPALIDRVAATSPLELRLNLLWFYAQWNKGPSDRDQIHAAAQGDRAAQRALLANPSYLNEDSPASYRRLMSLDPDSTKETILEILRRWYQEVFAEDEPRLCAILRKDAETKRALAATTSPEELMERATNGLQYTPQRWIRRVLLIPHVSMRPWNLMNAYDDVCVVGYPVADESLGVDVTAPPARLVRLHKALGDEKRLRILKRLARSGASLQELADEVGLAKSSTHHHMVILRSAGLTRVTLEDDSRYTLRREFIPEASGWLRAFLEGSET
jgi:DNA-binding transcriptional ArsR family regulator